MYIAMINIHGLLRKDNIEMGKDADTGGQTRYVVDLAKEISKTEDISLDIFTRKLNDKRLSRDYNAKIEEIGKNVNIVRITCGGSQYIRKEKLWSVLDEAVDALIEYFVTNKRIPDAIHGHYADGGYIASEIATYFNIPLIFTGHSLGRNKLEYLRYSGLTDEKIEDYYNISKRIEQEERSIRLADLVITSTHYEKDQLYSAYENRDVKKFEVIPPGVELDIFFPYYHYEIASATISEEQKLAQYNMVSEINRFLINPDKPIILALCRPEARKNIDTLIEIYGTNKDLQAIANLAIFAGIRDDINEMEEGEKQVLTDMLLLMDRYDLYGKMAIPKHHNPQTDVPELYRIAALKGGLFISAAALENFGLTFIEASSVGLPFIGTDKGGVQDIYKNCHSGLLVDINSAKQIHDAIEKILTDKSVWDELSKNGVEKIREVYTWESHVDSYLDLVTKVIKKKEKEKAKSEKKTKSLLERMKSIDYLLMSDIDNTITGDDASIVELNEILDKNSQTLGFGVATGRSIESTKEILLKHKIKDVDIYITSVGSEIYYSDELIMDKGWAAHIRRRWYKERIIEALKNIDGITLQEGEAGVRKYKVSYDIAPNVDMESLKIEVESLLLAAKCPHNAIFSHESYLDILPYRANKGLALKYIAWKWKLNPSTIISAGDSGNDKDMLIKPFKGIVVANYEQSLLDGIQKKHIYIAKEPHARGLIEGLKHYKVLSN
ncbi:MAG: HAD-IIB family hydrolase [Spirochaetia bacterium]|nr:HAD-IIB family hydrolase [Spirochaetia bacterium]